MSRVGNRLDRQACVVGYVDALANRNANQLARDVADTEAADFICTKDQAVFHGRRGRLSGNPG